MKKKIKETENEKTTFMASNKNFCEAINKDFNILEVE